MDISRKVELFEKLKGIEKQIKRYKDRIKNGEPYDRYSVLIDHLIREANLVREQIEDL